ncbi:dynein axonemal intermediate chain 7-like [Montipora capricornis]|uniref:dynein axonemal intermediate chain 7-like n=1 Tax=Montipora capricornis TaxID=246305 RepID=UPI0035F15BD2
MPPKGAAKGKKSPKLTKAEKEKLKKEEAERKAREEEEARLQAEQEQREREERERQEKEEREQLRQQESARHQAEVDELKEKIENNSQQLQTLQQNERAKAKWERYMLCDGSPDLLSTSELNTYMNLWRDDKDNKPFNTVLQEGENTLKLIKELEIFVLNSEEEGFTEDEIQRLKQSIIQLEELICYKLDEATMNVLQNASSGVDPETQNLQFTSAVENVAVCVWGNIAKNPRVKSFTFQEIGFSMELPRVLAVGNVAVRIMHTKYDHLSPLSKSFYPKRKVKPPEVIVEEAPAVEATNGDGVGANKEGGDKEVIDDTLEAVPPKSASQASKFGKQSRKKSGRTSSGKSSRSRRASAKSVRSQTSDNEPQQDKEGETKDAGNQEGDGEDKPSSAEQAVEEAAANAEGGLEDEEEEDDDVVDLRAFSVIGPVMFIELLELPPQPKLARGWTMQQIVSLELKRLSYQAEGATATDSNSANSTPAPPSSASATQVQSTNPPVMVTCKLPEHVMYFEPPQLAYWDSAKNNWRLDAFTDSQYDEEKRCIQFKMSSFGPVATFQDLYLNMPFQSWELRPHSTNSCLFTLIAAIIELEIEIKDSMCALTQPDDSPELAHLSRKWMKPHQLIEAMRKAGVNVFPAVDAEKYVSINSKEDWLEQNIYQEMALTASAFAYTWSKWNADCGKDKIIIQAVEQLQDEQPLEEDWSLFNIGTHNSCKLRMKEEDSELSNDVAENTQLHSDLYHMVLDGASEEAQQRVNDSHFLFIDCVYQLLNGTKIITYS